MKKKIFGLLSILFVSVMLTNVNAVELFEAGDTVTQEGTYDSIRFVAGNNVINKAEVDGLSFVAGNEITLSGSAPYGFYAGNIVTVNEVVAKDMFVAGNNVTISSSASIGRDLFVAGNIVNINTDVARDLRAGGTVIDISGVTINGDAYIDASEIKMDENTKIVGKLSYYKDTEVKGLDKATIGETEEKEYDEIEIEYGFKERAIDFVVSTIASFITLVVLFFMIPSTKEKLNKVELTAGPIFKAIGIGFVSLIVVPIASIIALFTGVLTPVALIALVIYVIAIYLSSLLASYVVGNLINTKLCKNENVYLSLIIGVVVIKAIKLVPVIGGLVGAASLFYGLGLITKYIMSRGK